MLTNHCNDQLYLIGVREQTVSETCTRITFFTTRGDLNAYARVSRGARRAVILLGGSEGESGLDSEFGLIADDLARLNIGSIQLDYRFPGDCAQCAIDALLLCQYLDDEGIADVALAGWSFGAGVALAAGSVCRTVRGVAAISPVDVSQCCVRWMGGKPLLLMRGEDDEVCPIDNVGRISLRTGGCARTIVYPGAGHDLIGILRKASEDLVDWISNTFDPARAPACGPVVGAMIA
jgi:pimeloyl-ACP methyl ester carboxylesterase